MTCLGPNSGLGAQLGLKLSVDSQRNKKKVKKYPTIQLIGYMNVFLSDEFAEMGMIWILEETFKKNFFN